MMQHPFMVGDARCPSWTPVLLNWGFSYLTKFNMLKPETPFASEHRDKKQKLGWVLLFMAGLGA